MSINELGLNYLYLADSNNFLPCCLFRFAVFNRQYLVWRELSRKVYALAV